MHNLISKVPDTLWFFTVEKETYFFLTMNSSDDYDSFVNLYANGPISNNGFLYAYVAQSKFHLIIILPFESDGKANRLVMDNKANFLIADDSSFFKGSQNGEYDSCFAMSIEVYYTRATKNFVITQDYTWIYSGNSFTIYRTTTGSVFSNSSTYWHGTVTEHYLQNNTLRTMYLINNSGGRKYYENATDQTTNLLNLEKSIARRVAHYIYLPTKIPTQVIVINNQKIAWAPNAITNLSAQQQVKYSFKLLNLDLALTTLMIEQERKRKFVVSSTQNSIERLMIDDNYQPVKQSPENWSTHRDVTGKSYSYMLSAYFLQENCAVFVFTNGIGFNIF